MFACPPLSLVTSRIILVLARRYLVCTIAAFIQVSHILPLFMQLGDQRVDIKKITDKFFAHGTEVPNFLNASVRVQGAFPVTTRVIRGLPRIWRRAFGHPASQPFALGPS